jgi:ABC-type uncharacterized transport system permease subunit
MAHFHSSGATDGPGFKPKLLGCAKANGWEERRASSTPVPLRTLYWRRVGIPILIPSFVGAFFLLLLADFPPTLPRARFNSGNGLVPIIIMSFGLDGCHLLDQTNLGDALAVE